MGWQKWKNISSILTPEGGYVPTREYSLWRGMKHRCNQASKNFKPSYMRCTYVKEWEDYDVFHDYVTSHKFYTALDDKGVRYDMEKDFSSKNFRGTIYSPETVTFLPTVLNSFVTDRKQCRGDSPIGLHRRKDGGKYTVHCNNPFSGSLEYFGIYSDIDIAAEVYAKQKEKLARELANYWMGRVDDFVVEALLGFKVIDSEFINQNYKICS